MQIVTKEHYDLMESFERQHKRTVRDREDDKGLWAKGYIYKDGHLNSLFIAFRQGYALGKRMTEQHN